MSNLLEKNVIELSALLKKKEISSVELTKIFLNIGRSVVHFGICVDIHMRIFSNGHNPEDNNNYYLPVCTLDRIAVSV